MIKINQSILPLCILMLSLLLQSGCSSAAGSRENEYLVRPEEVITIWAWDENFNIPAADMAIEKYCRQHEDISIEVITMSQEETVARMKSAMVSGADNLLPDIVLIEDYRIQYFLKNYEEEFLELSDMLSEQDFASYKMGVNQVDGRIYGVPFDSGVVGLFYRLDYVEAAGFREEDMNDLTWAQYIEIGKAVKEATGKDMLTLDPSDLPLIRMMLQSAGEWYCDEQGEVYISDNQALMDAIRVYCRIVEAGIAKPVSDWNQFVRAFRAGEVASVVSGSWISSTIVEEQSQSGLWRVASLPRMEENAASVNVSSVGGSGWYVMKNGGQAQEAKQFLQETFATDTELLGELVDVINLVGTLKSAEKSRQYQEGVAFYGGQKIFQDFIKWTYAILPVNYGTSTYEIESYVAEAIQRILTGEDMTAVLAEYQRLYRQDM